MSGSGSDSEWVVLNDQGGSLASSPVAWLDVGTGDNTTAPSNQQQSGQPSESDIPQSVHEKYPGLKFASETEIAVLARHLKLEGVNIVVSGVFLHCERTDIEKFFADRGARLRTSISPRTCFAVIGEHATAGKVDKLSSLQIACLTEEGILSFMTDRLGHEARRRARQDAGATAVPPSPQMTSPPGALTDNTDDDDDSYDEYSDDSDDDSDDGSDDDDSDDSTETDSCSEGDVDDVDEAPVVTEPASGPVITGAAHTPPTMTDDVFETPGVLRPGPINVDAVIDVDVALQSPTGLALSVSGPLTPFDDPVPSFTLSSPANANTSSVACSVNITNGCACQHPVIASHGHDIYEPHTSHDSVNSAVGTTVAATTATQTVIPLPPHTHTTHRSSGSVDSFQGSQVVASDQAEPVTASSGAVLTSARECPPVETQHGGSVSEDATGHDNGLVSAGAGQVVVETSGPVVYTHQGGCLIIK